jgi:predicted RNase H-like HicB family nuclease
LLCQNGNIIFDKKLNVMQYSYKILMHKEPEGGFTVTVPALPGCITYGTDIEHGLSMAKEAITLYIEELKERGETTIQW